MISHYAILLGPLLLSTVSVSFTPGFPYGSDKKVRGVNLGGWLVLEPWITPSLFDNTGDSRIIDEYTFGQYQDRAKATNVLRDHWDTWITEDDFRAIAGAGLNHIRIPIGYWAYDISAGEPYIQGQIPYLTKAINWASKYNLKVIVDLHGAPGSQNGFDNSGQKLSYPTWHTNQKNIDRTDAIIKTIADNYKDLTSVVSAIAPLNEPAGFFGEDVLNVTKLYWYSSYDSIRYPHGSVHQKSDNVVVIHNAFQPLSYWDGFMPSPRWEGVIIDTHIYQIFSVTENQRSEADHIKIACNTASSFSTVDIGVIVGEWTPAATDCAKYLNGRGIGSRYDGSFPSSTRVGSCTGKTGKASTFSPAYKTFLRQYWEAQTSTFEQGEGWIQWTWKTEIADEWSYQAGLANGWIPKDPSSRQYHDICG